MQYGIRTLLGLMIAVGVIFGSLRWMEVSTPTSLIILGILIVSFLAAVGLLFAIAKIDDHDDDGNQDS